VGPGAYEKEFFQETLAEENPQAAFISPT